MHLCPSSSPIIKKVKKPLYIWNLMVRSSANHGLFNETLKIYSSMLRYGVHGDSHTYPLVLKACSNLSSIRDGQKLHSHVIQNGFQGDVFVQTALIDMYSKCFRLESSRQVFDEMSIRSTVSWNAMISAYIRCSRMNQALILLKEMWVLGFRPDSSTFVSVLSGFSSLDSYASFCQGLSIHSSVLKLGLTNIDAPLANTLISMYVNFGIIDGASIIFNNIAEKSVVSWTTMIGGYANAGQAAEAFSLFNQMRRESNDMDSVVFQSIISGIVQVGNVFLASSLHSLILKSGHDNECLIIQNLLVNMYAKCGCLTSARRLFDMVCEKSIFLWISMIEVYICLDHSSEALHLFRKLLRTATTPDETTLTTILSTCADLGSLSMGEEIEAFILLNGLESNQRVQTSLIHMFCKCGSINKAREVFDRAIDKDLAVWSSMINGYAIHGMGKEALRVFHKMQKEEGIKPDSVVYTSILLACSHSGLVEDGLKYFQSMQKDFGIEPTWEHYACLVDLLGRVGQLDMAMKAIQEIPVKAQVQAWAALLSACKTYCNIELGELAAAKLLELNPGKSRNYVLMANLYSSMGKWKEADTTRKLIHNKRLVKERGWSKLEIDGTFNVFIAGDKSHFQSSKIHKMLQELYSNLL